MSDTLYADLVLLYMGRGVTYKDIDPSNDDQRKAAFARMTSEGESTDQAGHRIIKANKLRKGDVFFASDYSPAARYIRKVSGGHIVTAHGRSSTGEEMFIPSKSLQGKKVKLATGREINR